MLSFIEREERKTCEEVIRGSHQEVAYDGKKEGRTEENFVTLLHKKLWTTAEGLLNVTKRVRRKGKQESVSEEIKAKM